MTVKILSSTSTFNGVAYNTNKTRSAKGELMLFKNFGYLQSSNNVSPGEIKNFLKAHSNRNTRVKDKQFHAMISCKGRELDKKELTQMAEKWLHKMGYGNNPYLIVFHGDTKNNHVHMVSSRIGNDGKKINDSMERVRAQKHMLEIMERNPEKECQKLLDKLNSFLYSTPSQARLYLESQGYGLKEKGEMLVIFKFGQRQGEYPLQKIEAKTNEYVADKGRIKQLSALIQKYRKIYSGAPVTLFEKLKGDRLGKATGYRSELGDFLKEKFGVELIFHGKEGKKPYGYTIIDHSKRIIFKGSEVFPLKTLAREDAKGKLKVINFASDGDKAAYQAITGTSDTLFRFKRMSHQTAYRLKLLSALEDFPNPRTGLEKFHLHFLVNEGRLYLLDSRERYFVSLDSVLRTNEYNRFAHLWEVPVLEEGLPSLTDPKATAIENSQGQNQNDTDNMPPDGRTVEENRVPGAIQADFQLDIHQDVDDEAMHGRRRNREKVKKRKSIR